MHAKYFFFGSFIVLVASYSSSFIFKQNLAYFRPNFRMANKSMCKLYTGVVMRMRQQPKNSLRTGRIGKTETTFWE